MKKLKNLFLFIGVIAFTGCCKNDKIDCELNPPEWIIGSWESENNTTKNWHFYSDNIEYQVPSSYNGKPSYYDMCIADLGEEVSVSEEIKNDSVYGFIKIILDGSGQKLYYTFIKLSNGNIGYCSTNKYPCNSYDEYFKI